MPFASRISWKEAERLLGCRVHDRRWAFFQSGAEVLVLAFDDAARRYYVEGYADTTNPVTGLIAYRNVGPFTGE